MINKINRRHNILPSRRKLVGAMQKNLGGAGEMFEQLGMLTAHQRCEFGSWYPIRWLTIAHNSRPRGPETLSSHQGNLHAHVHTPENTYIWIKIKFCFFKEFRPGSDGVYI